MFTANLLFTAINFFKFLLKIFFNLKFMFYICLIKLKKMKKAFKAIVNFIGFVLTTILAFILLLYFYGLVGLIRSFKDKNDKDCNYYTGVTIANMLVWVTTIYLIYKKFYS